MYYKLLARLMAATLVGAAQIWWWCSTTCRIAFALHFLL